MATNGSWFFSGLRDGDTKKINDRRGGGGRRGGKGAFKMKTPLGVSGKKKTREL